MDVMEKIYKHKIAIAFFISAVCLVGAFASPVCQSNVDESSILNLIVYALIGVVIAVALIPTIANQSHLLEINAELDGASQTLVGLWPLLVVVGVFLAIIKLAI